MKTAELIKSAREKKGLTQKQLAEKLRCGNKNFISMLEAGQRNLPLRSAKLFCEILDINHGSIINALTDDYKDHVKRLSDNYKKRVQKYMENQI